MGGLVAKIRLYFLFISIEIENNYFIYTFDVTSIRCQSAGGYAQKVLSFFLRKAFVFG